MTMDKTGKTGDGGRTPAGQNLQPGSEQTSAAEQLTSSIEEGKQYSGVAVKKLVEDALSADGREQKGRAEKAEGEVTRLTGQVSGLTAQYNTVSSQVAELLKAKDDAELAQYSEDKPAQDSIRVKQANRAEALRLQGVAADYDAKSAKFTEREADLAKSEASVNTKLAALSAGVDEAELADLVPDGNPARLKKAADILKKRGPTSDQLRSGKPPGLGQRPASAISVGGGLGDLSPDEKITKGLALKK